MLVVLDPWLLLPPPLLPRLVFNPLAAKLQGAVKAVDRCVVHLAGC